VKGSNRNPQGTKLTFPFSLKLAKDYSLSGEVSCDRRASAHILVTDVSSRASRIAGAGESCSVSDGPVPAK